MWQPLFALQSVDVSSTQGDNLCGKGFGHFRKLHRDRVAATSARYIVAIELRLVNAWSQSFNVSYVFSNLFLMQSESRFALREILEWALTADACMHTALMCARRDVGLRLRCTVLYVRTSALNPFVSPSLVELPVASLPNRSPPLPPPRYTDSLRWSLQQIW